MAYHEGTASSPPTPQSLLGDSNRTIERLSEMHTRLVKVGDTLHGSQPMPSNVKPGVGGLSGSTVRSNLDRIHSLVCDIDREIQRIEARL